MSASAKDDKRREEFPGVTHDIETGASPTDGTSSGTPEIVIRIESDERQYILHKVPQEVREKNKQLYEPLVVSLGPYHHGQPRLHRYEHFKDEVLNFILNSDGGAKDKCSVFSSEVLKRVDEIRSFYEGLSKDEYDDEALAELMVRDACFLLYYMEIPLDKKKSGEHFERSMGLLGSTSMYTDILKLENQIPWWVIKLLISFTYHEDDKSKDEVVEEFLQDYFSKMALDVPGCKRVPWGLGKDKEPPHFLEAYRRSGIKEKTKGNSDNHDKGGSLSSLCPTSECRWWTRTRKSSKSKGFELIKRSFRCATELKAKGIYFKPTSGFVDDVKFSSYSHYGELHLPILVVESSMTTVFSNFIAMELSPGSRYNPVITSYVNFMKSLIEKPEDVKLLQENGIIISYLEDNQHMVKLINEIDTHGVDNFYIFKDIRKDIDEHCNSKPKTWISELIHTYFRTPWSVAAFFAATFGICLTLFQTYYTVYPRSTPK